ELLSGRHVIFIDVGCPQAVGQAREIFASTMAEQVVMTLDDHDRLIAYVLGLSHAPNIAFLPALAGSGAAATRLAQLSSTTYDAQVDVATKVAGESPELYFEIQHLNQYGRESLQALREAVELVWQSVTTRADKRPAVTPPAARARRSPDVRARSGRRGPRAAGAHRDAGRRSRHQR